MHDSHLLVTVRIPKKFHVTECMYIKNPLLATLEFPFIFVMLFSAKNVKILEGMLQENGKNRKWFVTLSGSKFQGARNPKWFLTLSGL